MPCLRCGAQKTINAHLIARVFAREVQIGKAHAAGIRPDGRFRLSQSGLYDSQILCGPCDGQLGKLDDYAARTFRHVRRKASGQPPGVLELSGVNSTMLLRFYASVLWRYSIARPDLGRIDLGDHQDSVKCFAFAEIPTDPHIDAFLLRLKRYTGDDGVFAYRAPMPDIKRDTKLFRIMVGGILAIVRVDERPLIDPAVAQLWLSAAPPVRVLIGPAQLFEEFREPKRLIDSTAKLDQFLERQAEVAASRNPGT